jgi:hydroxymethylglutaryl-CoA reductase
MLGIATIPSFMQLYHLYVISVDAQGMNMQRIITEQVMHRTT